MGEPEKRVASRDQLSVRMRGVIADGPVKIRAWRRIVSQRRVLFSRNIRVLVGVAGAKPHPQLLGWSIVADAVDI